MMVSPNRFKRSMASAVKGIILMWREEQNFRIELVASCIVLVLMFSLNIERRDAVVIILLMAIILSLEIVNSVLERVVDILKPRLHNYVAVIKDLMAALVLIAVFITVIIGSIILLPYLLR